jgi:hypothetical protein
MADQPERDVEEESGRSSEEQALLDPEWIEEAGCLPDALDEIKLID